MSVDKKEPNYHIAGYDVAPETISGIGSTVANFIPSPWIGSVLNYAAESIGMEARQANFVKIWKSAIARKLGVHEQDLDGDNGVSFVSAHIHELPKALQDELHKIEDLESKTSSFLASGFAQIGGGALVGLLLGGVLFPPLGLILGLAGGAAAGYVASLLMKDVTGDFDELTPSEAIPAIHRVAMQDQGHSKGAVPIDTTLLGAYLIAAHSAKGGVLEGYNTEDLKRMFNEHMTAKAEHPHAHTELDDYIQGLNRAGDNPFVLLLPKNMDVDKIQGGSVLHTIAMNMHSQQDLENWLFDPDAVRENLTANPKRHPATLDQAQLLHAGKSLHQAIEVPVNERGTPAPTAHKNAGQYLT